MRLNLRAAGINIQRGEGRSEESDYRNVCDSVSHRHDCLARE